MGRLAIEHLASGRRWNPGARRCPAHCWTTCPLLDNVRLFTEACSFLSAEDLDWIMGRGVAEWLSWQVSDSQSNP